MLNSVSFSEARPPQLSLTLQAGDMIQGKLLQLLSDGRATILVNGEKIEAKLQVPLQQGKTYLWQIQQVNHEVLLKEIPATSVKAETVKAEIVNKILTQLSLPKGGFEQKLVQLAVQAGWLTENSNKLSVALQWLSASQSKNSDHQVIEYMSRSGLPFTQDVFQSLTSVFSGKDFSSLLKTLQSSSEATLPIMKEIMIPLEARVGYKVATMALSSSPQTQDSQISRQWVAQTIQSMNISGLVKDAPNRILDRQIQQLLEKPVLQQWEQGNRAYAKGNLQDAIAIWRTVLPSIPASATNEEVLRLLIQDQFGSLPVSSSKIEAVETLFKQTLSLPQEEKFLPLLGKEVLARLSEKIEPALRSNESSQTQLIRTILVTEFKEIFKAVGLNLEAELAKGNNESVNSLKANLLQLLQQEHTSQKQTVQDILSHLQGQKLFTQELGPIIQLFTQIPLPFINELKDANISWSGKKTKEGRIDPHHCRILFHLHLSHLGETMLDVQIQNKIVSLQIFHRLESLDTPRQEVIDSFKNGMKQIGYQLSGIQFNYVSDEARAEKLASIFQQFQSSSRVDVRI